MIPLRAIVSEWLGTAFLLAAVVGSGIMGERLAEGNVALTLLANSLATGAALVVLILTFEPASGAHFNPVVSLAEASRGGISWRAAGWYVAAQIVGAFVGVALVHLMFEEPIFTASEKARVGWPLALGEIVATFGLVTVVQRCARQQASMVPFAVGAYITAAYWFTSSTSFANPAVTLARTATNTFTGIRVDDVPGFLVAQAVGATLAILFSRWMDSTL